MKMYLLLFLSAVTQASYGQNPAEIDAYLQELQRREVSYVERVVAAAKDGVGTPYHDGPLGEGPKGVYDTDPLIDLSRADCVTYVEQCMALAASASYGETVKVLQEIRYAKGHVDFVARNHFMMADWVPNNSSWCRESTGTLGIATESVTRTISKRDFFKRVKAPELGQDIADRSVTVQYIPIREAAAAAQAIRRPSIVVFLGKIDWLFALHCGIFIPSDGGGGQLYHASSKSGAVVAADLGEYAGSQSNRYLGFSVIEITTPRAVAPTTSLAPDSTRGNQGE